MKNNKFSDMPLVVLRNLVVILGLCIIATVLAVAYVIEYLKGIRTLDYVVKYLIMLLLTVSVTTTYYMFHSKDKASVGLVSAIMYIILYIYTLATAQSIGVYVYIIPFLILLLVYDDTKLLLFTTITSTVSSIIILSVRYDEFKNYTLTDIEIAFACMVLVTVFLFISRVGTLRAYNRLKELEEELLTDTLTRCNNRKFLEKLVEDGFFMHKGVSVILGDINNFKSINDTYGHTVGDIALIHVGKCLRDVCARYDNTWEIRIGGDEFLIVTDKSFTDKIIDECYNLCNSPEMVAKLGFDIKVSFGQSKNESGKRTWQQLYEEADKQMYSVKESMKGND